MKLICGLGNPGKKFKNTRHNVGFEILDFFARKSKFPKFKLERKFKSQVTKKKFGKEKIVLIKPQTFMNESGKAIKLLIVNWKLEIGNLIVIHDEIDLPLGKIKISFEKGSAGHKGVQSIIDQLGRKDFLRLRIGINLPTVKIKRKKKNFVLEKFTKKEKIILKKVFEKGFKALWMIIKEGKEKAMSEFNK